MTLELVPLRLATAHELVRRWHRHHKPTPGGLFAIGVAEEGSLVGAVVVGRPVARHLDDGTTAEVVRCVTDGTKNASSMLYGAAWRAWRAMGGHRLVTYTLPAEGGASLRGAGWRIVHETTARPRGWDTPSRRRPANPQSAKWLWEVEGQIDDGVR